MPNPSPDEMSFGSRRDFLSRSCNGLGALALAGMTAEMARADGDLANPLAGRASHNPRRAKHCIFLFMQGGVSQVDSFDYKPLLNTLHGKPLNRIPNITGELQGNRSFDMGMSGLPSRMTDHRSRPVSTSRQRIAPSLDRSSP